MITTALPPTLDPAAAARWMRCPQPVSPWLHEEVGRRMQERLDVVRMQPGAWADWESWRGGVQSHRALHARYPGSSAWLVVQQPHEQRLLRSALTPSWWQRWRPGRVNVHWGVPQPGVVQMVWANMLLHSVAEPQALLSQWHRSLATDGFLMFSCLGPDTLRELRQLYLVMGWPAPAHEFTDMHDWGDMLVAQGFAEPVMDMERITLTFATPQRLLQELRELGRNLSRARFPGLRGRGWANRWLQAVDEHGPRNPQGQLQLTFEVIYGHALRPMPRPAILPQNRIALDDMRQMLSRRPSPPA